MKLYISTFLLLLTLLRSVCVYAETAEPSYEVDHLAVATVMIYDGRLDKAEAELSLVDTSANNFDAARYYTISGVLDSKKGAYENAIENYIRAIRETEAGMFGFQEETKKQKYLFSIGQADEDKIDAPVADKETIKKEKLEKLHLYLAQAYYKVKNYTDTVKHLDLAGARGEDRSSLFALRAECHWQLKHFGDAIHALDRGLDLFPDDAALLQQKYYYFADLGLYQAAIECARKYMKTIDAIDKEYIILAQLLLEADQPDEAIKILETAKAAFPKSANVDMLLGHAYMKKNMNYTAAELFKDGAYLDKKYLKDAVEIHRRIKDYAHAIYLNAQMNDPVEKLKQKVAIYLDRGEFEKVIGLHDDLERYSILEDDNMRYAIAYSYYMAKDFSNAEYHIKQIKMNTLFVKGTVILRNIERCRQNITECF